MKPTRKQVNEILSESWTPVGIKRWWDRPRHLLDGKTPKEMWEIDPQKVYDLAIEGREMGGT